jgi:hypothetical protein
MMVEHVIKVSERPLPPSLIESPEYQALSPPAQRAFLAHVRYLQELPFKLEEWSNNGALSSEIQPLVERIDLDIAINLSVPNDPANGVSSWVLQVSWVTHSRPLTEFLRESHIVKLNTPVPPIGSGRSDVELWIRSMSEGLRGLLGDFFDCENYDQSVAHLVAIHTCLAGLKFGIGRIRLHYPS